MDFKDIELFDLQDCQYCGGAGFMEYEGGCCCYVQCVDCGAQTPYMEYKSEADRAAAESAVLTPVKCKKLVWCAASM